MALEVEAPVSQAGEVASLVEVSLEVLVVVVMAVLVWLEV